MANYEKTAEISLEEKEKIIKEKIGKAKEYAEKSGISKISSVELLYGDGAFDSIGPYEIQGECVDILEQLPHEKHTLEEFENMASQISAIDYTDSIRDIARKIEVRKRMEERGNSLYKDEKSRSGNVNKSTPIVDKILEEWEKENKVRAEAVNEARHNHDEKIGNTMDSAWNTIMGYKATQKKNADIMAQIAANKRQASKGDFKEVAESSISEKSKVFNDIKREKENEKKIEKNGNER